ncbi:MAG: DUF2235 domain-containing protein [Desulfobacterales bacterium]|nr:DUF2235 domain-containing protein [Desulfobacterales bacterium]
MAGKKIILCFDGTCNDPNDAKKKKNIKLELKDASISNIFKLHLLLGGGVSKGEEHIKGQKSFYYSGVGTYGNKLLQWFNAGLALPNMDVGRIIKKASVDLAKNYQKDDEVFIFGFSRGAAIARRFAATMNKHVRAVNPNAPLITVKFLGVFDTVASIGFPNLDDDKKPISDVKFENCTVADTVETALHMVSLDDKRTAYMPTLMAYDEKRVTEIWFTGGHSDIGGGYRYDGLSDITLNYLIEAIAEQGLEIRSPLQINFESDECRELGLAYDDIAIQPNPMGKIHQQDRSLLLEWTLTHRDLRVHLDQPADGRDLPLPLIHHTVVDRIHGDSDYRPVSLSKRTLDGRVENEISHRVWRPGNTPYQEVKGLGQHLKTGPPAPRKLDVGESAEIIVYANTKMNRSYVYANKNETYGFSVDMAQTWFDSGITCGPGGWDRQSEDFPWYREFPIKWMEDERRCPKADWFEVVGVIGKRDQTPFRVLSYTRSGKYLKSGTQTGELFFFANDLEDRYANNLGFIKITVTRQS